MTIEISSCRKCPFISTEKSFGEAAWECSRGAFGLSSTPPKKNDVHECCPLRKEEIIIKLVKKSEGLTEEEYNALVKRSEEASRNNDYSNMINMGDDNYKKMKKYRQDNICKHPNVQTNGGGDYCTSCGKTW